MSTEGRRRSYDLPPPPGGALRPPPAPHHPPSGEKGWRYTLRVPSWSQAQLPDGETAVFYQAGRGDHLAGMTPHGAGFQPSLAHPCRRCQHFMPHPPMQVEVTVLPPQGEPRKRSVGRRFSSFVTLFRRVGAATLALSRLLQLALPASRHQTHA